MAASYNKNRSVCYPVVVVEIDGVKCRTLLDTGAGSSYVSCELRLKIKPVKVERRHIEMMIGSVMKNIEIYQLRAKSLESDFSLEMQVSKVNGENFWFWKTQDTLISSPSTIICDPWRWSTKTIRQSCPYIWSLEQANTQRLKPETHLRSVARESPSQRRRTLVGP